MWHGDYSPELQVVKAAREGGRPWQMKVNLCSERVFATV